MNAVTKSEAEAAPVNERTSYRLPPVNIYETEQGYLLEADVPGVTRESLEIYLDRNDLTILGRRGGSTPEGATHHRESGEGDFRRVFELAPEIDTNRISARVESGVLTLELAKREEVKPRRIRVTD